MKQIVKNFNNLIQKTIFKVQNKTIDKLQISKFNKYLITFISLLFFYLFYLSIPILYDKNWVQRNIEKQLYKDFKIYFSLSSDVSYRILPSPHYLIKDSKILNVDNKATSLVEIKNLKVFISQRNFFDKQKTLVRYVRIDNADFTLKANDLKLLKNSTNSKFSNKKIKINKSKIFFKNNLGEILSIIKVSDAFLFYDDKNLLNLFNLRGEVFNVPFKFDYNKKHDSLKSEEIIIDAKKLKLNIFDINSFDENNGHKGKNITSFLNSKIDTSYKFENDMIIFNSINSRINNSKLNYSGVVSINPFDLNLNIDLDNLDLNKIFDNNSILNELIRTELLFNDNISMSVLIKTGSNLKSKIFKKTKIYFNIKDGKLNIDKTQLTNEKIGSVELGNSNLSFEDKTLILKTDIIIDIKNSNELFSLLQTNKKFRKPINNIIINLDYDFLSKKIDFHNIKIDNKEIDVELLRVIEDFNDISFSNINKSKRILNDFFKIYEG